METITIQKLFRDQGRRFEIPSYQRSYSWEKKHISQFLQDLDEASHDYYLGHFLFEEARHSEKGAVETLLVIDGQQRLTTCVIFFSALCEELQQRRNNGACDSIDPDDIAHLYLRDARKHTQKLKTVSDDNSFFADEIIDRRPAAQSNVVTRSQERIREARIHFRDAFKKASLPELERWHDLVSNAKCTEYRVQDKAEAARIFSFQNDRGKDLTDVERLKSFFMLQVYLRGGSPEAVDEHLEYIETAISRIYHQIVRIDLDEDDVLRYCWQGYSGSPGFNTRDTVQEIKRQVLKDSDVEPCEWIKSFMNALAQAFYVVEKVEKGTGANLVNLRYLNTMRLSYPFFIRAWIHGASEPQLERLAGVLENITFRSLLRGGRADIEARLNNYLRMAADSSYVEEVVAGSVHSLRNDSWWSYWSDEVLDVLDGGYFYGNRVDNYALWRYEMHLCSGTSYSSPLKVCYSDLISNESIEHIAPQTESEGVVVANGYGIYDDKEVPEDGIKSGHWLHCLGNLMLVSQSHNSSIGNHPFSVKLDSYGKDNLLNQQKEIHKFVADAANPVWDRAAIERRQEKILKAAKALWSLDDL